MGRTEDPHYAVDHDSEDSNRESADANDYPDEELICSDDEEPQQQRRHSDDFDGIVLGSAKKPLGSKPERRQGCQSWLD